MGSFVACAILKANMPRPRKGPLWRKAFRLKLKKHTVFSIAQVLFLSCAALIMVSFARQGALLTAFNDIFLKNFGWTSIFLPFILLVSGLMLSKFRTPINQPNVLVGALLFFLCLTALTRSGFIGKESWGAIETLITGVGAGLVYFGGALIGLLVLFNTSLDQFAAHILSLLIQLRYTIVGQTRPALNPKGGIKLGGMKVTGGDLNPAPAPVEDPKKSLPAAVNLPGEDGIWEYPPISLLQDLASGKADRGDIKANAAIIERTFESFGIQAKVVEVNLGPRVTQYAIEVALGTKLSKVTNLSNDLALALAAPSGQIRIEAPIPGRALVGIELPNRAPEYVPLRKILETDTYKESRSKLTLAMGLDVSGKAIVTDLAKSPHALIAGQTGSGKSFAVNAFITSILFRASPNEVKFILVDPKRVELTGYNGIPHLLSPVIVEPEKVVSALKYLVNEMNERYKMFSEVGARNIESYNEISGFQALPYIVLVIDELADIMLFSPAEVEDAIIRIAQMSRATGIHMLLATQRPSVDVLTGLIKANVPTRMAFAVSSLVDSRVILDTPGAEKLLGKGDMLFLPSDEAKPRRIQGAYITDGDTTRLLDYLRKNGVAPQYTEEVTNQPIKSHGPGNGPAAGERDEMFEQAVRIICGHDKASASLLQRRLSIGYARAARILDQLEAEGVVSPADGSKPREVLITNPDEFLNPSTA